MIFSLDARVPVVIAALDAAGSDDAVLLEGDIRPPPGMASASFHPRQSQTAPCACCAIRGAAGRALAELLQARARGRVKFFRRVVAVAATEAGRAEIVDALTNDPVASSCFRLASA
jgi:hypothetical protein